MFSIIYSRVLDNAAMRLRCAVWASERPAPAMPPPLLQAAGRPHLLFHPPYLRPIYYYLIYKLLLRKAITAQTAPAIHMCILYRACGPRMLLVHIEVNNKLKVH